MRETKINTLRLRQLEKAERTLNALAAGGVDNWEGYGDSLEPLRIEEEINELAKTFLEEVEECLLRNAYEPSERGAGYCSNDDDREEASVLMFKFLNKLKEVQDTA